MGYNYVDANNFVKMNRVVFLMNGINLPQDTAHGFLFAYYFDGLGFTPALNGMTLQFFIQYDAGTSKIFFRRAFHDNNSFDKWHEK